MKAVRDRREVGAGCLRRCVVYHTGKKKNPQTHTFMLILPLCGGMCICLGSVPLGVAQFASVNATETRIGVCARVCLRNPVLRG